jgi:hypothetical protein
VASAIASRLRPFRAPLAIPEATATITVGGSPPAILDQLPWTAGRRIYESEAGVIRFVEDQDLLLLDSAAARAWAYPHAGELSMYAPHAGSSSAWLLSHPFLTIPLMEMLKRRSIFSVHAGAVSDQGRAVLLAGPSGAGKTTLTVSLVRHGLAFLGDDLTFVAGAEGDGPLRLLPFADEVDLLPDAADHFPGLRPALAPPRPPGWPKHSLRLEDVTDAQLSEACTPVGVVLLGPRTGRPEPRLEAAPSGAALFELAPNVLLTEPVSSQAHLDALGRLTRQCPCYVLHGGTDLSLTAASLASLLG